MEMQTVVTNLGGVRIIAKNTQNYFIKHQDRSLPVEQRVYEVCVPLNYFLEG